MTEGWRKVDNEEANMMTNKLRTVRRAKNVAGMVERCIQGYGRISEAKRRLEHANSMMILKTDAGSTSVTGYYKHGNEFPGSIKCRKIP